MKRVAIKREAGTFAQDKDVAARIREATIRPGLGRTGRVVVDFTGVDGATQSFVHALIADIVRSEGANVLERIEFHGCNSTVRSIIGIVAEYSQLELPPD
ncbi:MAG: STAS-like domain-containing protein [Thermoanaerobaculia bacterium]|nr:STAS-like domain-containing protein [Thermoanaerobaculia bacterium]